MFLKNLKVTIFLFWERLSSSRLTSFFYTHKLARGLIVFGVVGAALFFSYRPAFQFGYIHHDDTLFFLSDWMYKIYGCFIFNFFSGRFLGSFILEFAVLAINTVAGLTLIRYITWAIFTVCAFILIRWCRRLALGRGESLLFILTVFTLPYFEIVVSYAGIFFHALGMLFSIVAGFLAYHVASKKSPGKALKSPLFFLSIFLLVCALSTYQSVAVFYWALLGLVILFIPYEKEQLLKKQIFLYYGAGLAALFFYAGIFQVAKRYLAFYSHNVYNPYDISFDVGMKLVWFFKEPLMNSLNLWNIFPSLSKGVSVLVFILGSLLFFSVRNMHAQKKQGAPYGTILKSFAWRIGAFLPLFPLSFLPNMLWSGNVAFYRCCAGPSFLIAALLFWSLRQWVGLFCFENRARLVQGVLLFALVLGMVFSYQNIYRWIAYPNYLELELIKRHLAQQEPSAYSQIYLIRPGPGVLRERYDEFGFQTSNANMDRIGLFVGALRDVVSNRYSLLGMAFDKEKEEVSCFFAEPGKDASFRIGMSIFTKTPQEILSVTEPGFVIDTTGLYAFGSALSYLRKDAPVSP